MSDQRNQQNQQGGQGGQQQPGQGGQQKLGQFAKKVARQKEELDKKWREVANPGQTPGTGEPST